MIQVVRNPAFLVKSKYPLQSLLDGFELACDAISLSCSQITTQLSVTVRNPAFLVKSKYPLQSLLDGFELACDAISLSCSQITSKAWFVMAKILLGFA